MQTLFILEIVNSNVKDDDLRPGVPATFGLSKSKNIFKRWGFKLTYNCVIKKKVQADEKIELESSYSKNVKIVTKAMIQPNVPSP